MKISVAVLMLICFCSCEKNIDFNLKTAEPVLVADARIENGQAPLVVLTKSLGYFSKIDPQILAGSFIHNAEVYISNGSRTHRLKEYAYPLAPGLTAYFYSNDPSNLGTIFNGELNKNYSLRILSEGKEYTANTTIPSNAITLDSIWVRVAPQNPDTSKRVLFLQATDPHGLGNYGRYFTKVNSDNFLPGENSVFEDQVIDGTSFSAQLPKGIDRNDPPKPEDNFFRRGDTITMKFCNISQASYRFWSTWEFAFQGIGNPFAQPNKVVGNISNGALGAFCGYAVQYKTIVAH